jgi:hypothetical protein
LLASRWVLSGLLIFILAIKDGTSIVILGTSFWKVQGAYFFRNFWAIFTNWGRQEAIVWFIVARPIIWSGNTDFLSTAKDHLILKEAQRSSKLFRHVTLRYVALVFTI